MAAQRFTIAKLGGAAGEALLGRLSKWAATPDVRGKTGRLAGQLRANAFTPPVLHFVEWVDLWSMSDLIERWLTPPDCAPPLVVYWDQFELYGYRLPDGGRLARHLAGAGPQQFVESDWFVARLREAVKAWQELVEQAAVVVLREVVDVSVADEEVIASLADVPPWLTESGRPAT
jgi:hypothetical protein